MPSIPPPLTLSHRHTRSQSSNIDFDPSSPSAYAPNGYSYRSPRSPHTPRSSAPPSPMDARPHLTQTFNGSHRMSGDFGGASAEGGGLGNLADELADAWEEEEGGYGYASGQDTGVPEAQYVDRSDDEDAYHRMDTGIRSPSSAYSPEHSSLHPPKPKTRNGAHRHRRHESQYDGSDYGNDSDFEEADMPPSLEMQMAEIESLARRGLENNGSENDFVIQRAVEALRDLGGQSGIENNAMRYVLCGAVRC
ncbi:hypothetical protein BO70DRAFT_361722 [Aspergillus heteromorphus CBS 117.55]|uniref:Uncharacterized protein n=1 Tax=Aspergillus heteromorphus CBS 117.55 TaxID=1448321 RepID=A0A317W867_9EURO|nr:uncharacterized protein BO70DRAFT_361722 [Aspergillus heteromorphus CBS 117.55]PWY82816.1 hypothetical protein BO70DRAFT_361722 [Aspergillus heteromorphus CBS 117.55]